MTQHTRRDVLSTLAGAAVVAAAPGGAAAASEQACTAGELAALVVHIYRVHPTHEQLRAIEAVIGPIPTD